MYYPKEIAGTIHEQQFAYLQIEENAHVLTIRLNRPERKNAFNEVVVRELAFALSYAHHHHHIWAVVLAANGDVFCAGADLKAFAGEKDLQAPSSIPFETETLRLGDLFNHLHKPCIAQVQGAVYAGGFLMICGCTHVVASQEAVFGLPEVKRGIWPFQVMASLLRIIPARKVIDWCMLGKTLSAEVAHELGIVTHLVSPDALQSAVNQLVSEICQQSPSAIRFGLQAFDEMQSKPADQLHAYLHDLLQQVLLTKDAAEGILAFKEKRPPRWTGE